MGSRGKLLGFLFTACLLVEHIVRSCLRKEQGPRSNQFDYHIWGMC
jgi:hypothetical protein